MNERIAFWWLIGIKVTYDEYDDSDFIIIFRVNAGTADTADMNIFPL